MQADVERFSYQEGKHFLRVLEQQGRVALPADFNEQTAILLHHMQALARDLIGPHGTPTGNDPTKPGTGFQVTVVNGVLTIAQGRYWVEGRMCENDAPVGIDAQTDLPGGPPLKAGRFLVFLDVWERHLSAAQDDAIREVALGGPDTCSRSKLVWQARLFGLPAGAAITPAAVRDTLWAQWHPKLEPAPRGLLAARVDRGTAPLDPCQAAPGDGYFGNENQLYRVEVHRGAGHVDDAGAPLPPTFKWSRDNGSIIYPLKEIEGTTAVLLDPPIDCRHSLATDTLVEVVDDHSALLGRPGTIARVVDVDDDGEDVTVHLSSGPPGQIPSDRHPLLRRWDHPDVEGGGDLPQRADDGALEIAESASGRLSLEHGIKIRFAAQPAAAAPNVYRSGDFWTFPARAATGEITWPREADGESSAVAPHGIDHYFAPLAIAELGNDGKTTGPVVDVRLGFAPLATLLP